jgi:hypothetical protein
LGTQGTSGGITAPGRTFISGVIRHRIVQDGYIRQVKVTSKNVSGGALSVTFRVFRWNSDTSTYDFVSQSEPVSVANGAGARTYDLANPMVCRAGDLPGMFIPNQASTTPVIGTSTYVQNAAIMFVSADVLTSDVFGTGIDNLALDVEFLGGAPYLAATGDSIAEGHPNYHGVEHTGPAGTITNEIWHQLQARIPSLQYQNHALGSQGFIWALSTGVPACMAVSPHTVIVMCGVLDIMDERPWEDVQADLASIKALVLPPARLAVAEVLPWTAATDAQAGAIRTHNANLATWCTANGVQLLRTHDAMGKVRVATGELDDLKASYDADGIHLTDAGADAMAAIIRPQLR